MTTSESSDTTEVRVGGWMNAPHLTENVALFRTALDKIRFGGPFRFMSLAILDSPPVGELRIMSEVPPRETAMAEPIREPRTSIFDRLPGPDDSPWRPTIPVYQITPLPNLVLYRNEPRRYAIDFIYHNIRKAIMHEMDEWVIVDGVRPYDPHAGDPRDREGAGSAAEESTMSDATPLARLSDGLVVWESAPGRTQLETGSVIFLAPESMPRADVRVGVEGVRAASLWAVVEHLRASNQYAHRQLLLAAVDVLTAPDERERRGLSDRMKEPPAGAPDTPIGALPRKVDPLDDPAVRARIVEGYREGLFDDTIARRNRMTPTKLAAGRASRPQFDLDCHEALAEHEAEMTKGVREGKLASGGDDWKARAKALEMRYRSRYAEEMSIRVQHDREALVRVLRETFGGEASLMERIYRALDSVDETEIDVKTIRGEAARALPAHEETT